MGKSYTNEKNTQIVLALLKAHGIRKVIASPGATNVALVGSMQHDPYFEIYSSVDERSAAYLACGLAAESGEPVVISCTGATASRNYLPGLTEAYYRKLPVLAITSTQMLARVGQHVAQVIDRSSHPNDVAKLSVALPIVKDHDDFWECEVKVNQAILELTRHGGGPVHINLPTIYDRAFDTVSLPDVRTIRRVTPSDDFPRLSGKIAVFIGAHKTWSPEETGALERFCAANDAVVFCDHTSGYRGKHRLLFALAAGQEQSDFAGIRPDVMIHIGEITGDYETIKMSGRQVWRVSPDGEIRDTFRLLHYVFEMPERFFFENYSKGAENNRDDYFRVCSERLASLRTQIPDLPFSNIWLASRMAHRIPDESVIHFAILNSLRSWNFFDLPQSVSSASNTGGFGIDGGLSSLIGASLFNKSKLYYCVIGDLAFFYDMNALGNRHVGNNLRIMLVNNGKGTEFRNYNHHAARFEESADEFMAAAGHFGKKSHTLVKGYAEALGFDYISASNKNEFEQVYERFLDPRIGDRPILFEVFTDSEKESEALEMMLNIDKDPKVKAKRLARKILGDRSVDTLRKMIK